MRPYEPNSPEAVARIVALTLVSDGRLDAAELEMLKKVRAYDRMGLDETRFLEVLHAFCHDLLSETRASERECRLDGGDLVQLLRDLDDPIKQKVVLRLMLDVIRADGKLHKGESMLFWQAIEHWKMRISDVVLSVPRGFRRFPPAPRNPKRRTPRPQPSGLQPA